MDLAAYVHALINLAIEHPFFTLGVVAVVFLLGAMGADEVPQPPSSSRQSSGFSSEAESERFRRGMAEKLTCRVCRWNWERPSWRSCRHFDR